MITINGYIVRSEGAYHFRPYGWSVWFFWSKMHGCWLISNYHVIDKYWHRHLHASVDINKMMIR